MTGIELPENAAPDSHDFSAAIGGQKYDIPIRNATIHNTYESIWGIRKGDWVYINDSTGGHNKNLPQYFRELTGYKEFNTEGLLFNMLEDPEQRINLYDQHPEVVQKLASILENERVKPD